MFLGVKLGTGILCRCNWQLWSRWILVPCPAVSRRHAMLSPVCHVLPPTTPLSISDWRSQCPSVTMIPLHLTDIRWVIVSIFTISPLEVMNLPLRSYFFSPLNTKIDDSEYFCLSSFFTISHFSELRNHDQLLNVHNVEVQPTRRPDILTTFRVALYDQSRSSLLLLAESLRVRAMLLLLCYLAEDSVVKHNSISVEL